MVTKAGFLPSRSVIHVTRIVGSSQSFSESQITEIDVTPKGIRGLCRFIYGTYACGENQYLRYLGSALYDIGGF